MESSAAKQTSMVKRAGTSPTILESRDIGNLRPKVQTGLIRAVGKIGQLLLACFEISSLKFLWDFRFGS